MAKFTATVRVFDVEAADRQTARRLLESQVQSSNLGRCQVIAVEPAAPPLPLRQPSRPVRPKWWTTALGPLLMLGAALWTLWFYWLLLE